MRQGKTAGSFKVGMRAIESNSNGALRLKSAAWKLRPSTQCRLFSLLVANSNHTPDDDVGYESSTACNLYRASMFVAVFTVHVILHGMIALPQLF